MSSIQQIQNQPPSIDPPAFVVIQPPSLQLNVETSSRELPPKSNLFQNSNNFCSNNKIVSYRGSHIDMSQILPNSFKEELLGYALEKMQ